MNRINISLTRPADGGQRIIFDNLARICPLVAQRTTMVFTEPFFDSLGLKAMSADSYDDRVFHYL